MAQTVTVTMMSGLQLKILTTARCLIRDIKDLVEFHHGISVENQTLLHDGEVVASGSMVGSMVDLSLIVTPRTCRVCGACETYAKFILCGGCDAAYCSAECRRPDGRCALRKEFPQGPRDNGEFKLLCMCGHGA